jgi:hypothetical protein
MPVFELLGFKVGQNTKMLKSENSFFNEKNDLKEQNALFD